MYEWRLSKLLHYWERPECWEESWRLERTCYHSDSSEKPSANADVKNSNNNNKARTWLRKGNFKRETESLLIAVQNNAIRTNHIKAGIDKTQQNSKCRLWGGKDETINHIISECSKLVQEYKTRHDWVDKVIHWEMRKKLKFDHTNKWYMHNPASISENNS